jgi:hypothetical protein
VVASDGPGDYPVIAEARAGDDALGVVVAPGAVAYVTTGGLASLPASPRCCVRAVPGELTPAVLLGCRADPGRRGRRRAGGGHPAARCRPRWGQEGQDLRQGS